MIFSKISINYHLYMNHQYFIGFLFILLLCFYSCGNKSAKIGEKEPIVKVAKKEVRLIEEKDSNSSVEQISLPKAYVFPYDFSVPMDKKKLPNDLIEISGLDFLGGPLFACIQDEKANIYVYNWDTDEITSKIDFGKNGDFEDIEVVGKEIWVLRSDGDLYQILNFNTEEQTTQKYETHLNDSNDTEGLSLDASKKKLLLACKGIGGKSPELKGKKAVYSFDLATKTLSEKPVFTVSLEAIADQIQQDKKLRAFNKVAEFFNPESGNVTFQPSGIDIHPSSKNIYLIATAGKLLVVLNPKGTKILHIEPLDPEVFKQPEGICFMANGDLYISNEGRSGKANILKFSSVN